MGRVGAILRGWASGWFSIGGFKDRVEGVGERGIGFAAVLRTFDQVEAGQDLDRLFVGEAAIDIEILGREFVQRGIARSFEHGDSVAAEACQVGGEGAAVGRHSHGFAPKAAPHIEPLHGGLGEIDIGEAGEFRRGFAGAVFPAFVGAAKGEVLEGTDEAAGDEAATAEIDAAEFFEHEAAIDELRVADGCFGEFDVFEMAVDVAGLVFAAGGGVPGRTDAADLPFAPIKPAVLEEVAFISEIIEVGVVEGAGIERAVFADGFGEGGGREVA